MIKHGNKLLKQRNKYKFLFGAIAKTKQGGRRGSLTAVLLCRLWDGFCCSCWAGGKGGAGEMLVLRPDLSGTGVQQYRLC